MQVTTTNEFMDTEVEQLSVYLADALIGTNLGSVDGTISTSVGDLEYAFTDVMFQSLDTGDISYFPDAETSDFFLTVLDAAGELDFGFSLQLLSWPYTSDAGAGVVTFSDASVSAELTFPRDDTGAMGFEFVTLDTTLGTLSISLGDGIVAWLVDIVSDVLGDELNVLIAAVLDEAIRGSVEYFASESLFDTRQCRDDLCMDTRLARDPTVADAYISQLYGGTYYVDGAQDTYVAPTDFTTFPLTVNEKVFQIFFGPPSFTTYFAAVFDFGAFGPVNGTAAAADVAAAFPELAAAFPGADAALGFSLTAAPTAAIMYSALEVTLPVALAVAPAGADAAAAAFELTVTAAGDLDFCGHHGDAEPITGNKNCMSIELSPYSVDAAVAASDIGAVEVTDTLLAWLQDEFFAIAYDGAWAQALRDERFQSLNVAELDFVNRSFIYDPAYVVVTFDTVKN